MTWTALDRWILSDGVWDDDAIWVDSDVWIDESTWTTVAQA